MEASEEVLFNTPPELVCPLTLGVFLSPVLNAAGHVSAPRGRGTAQGTAWARGVGAQLPPPRTPARGTRRQPPPPARACAHTQVYEAAAIKAHLLQNDFDPLTRQKLLNK